MGGKHKGGIPVKIVIADDHALFAEGLKNICESKKHIIMGIAYDGDQAVEMAKKYNPDVMFIDIRMPKCNGLEATTLINLYNPDIKIIILTASENENDIKRAKSCGACCYLIKSFKSDVLFNILSDIEKGEKPQFPNLPKRSSEFEGILTKRQIQVIELLVKGHYYKEIANKLDISERTVRYHIEESIRRLGLKSKQQLINYIMKST